MQHCVHKKQQTHLDTVATAAQHVQILVVTEVVRLEGSPTSWASMMPATKTSASGSCGYTLPPARRTAAYSGGAYGTTRLHKQAAPYQRASNHNMCNLSGAC